MPDFDEKNRLGGLYPTSYCGPREIMLAFDEDGKSLKPEPILMTTGSQSAEFYQGGGFSDFPEWLQPFRCFAVLGLFA